MEDTWRQAAEDIRELSARGQYCALELAPYPAWMLLGTLHVVIQHATAESPLHKKMLQQIVADLELYFRAYPALKATAAVIQDRDYTLST